VGNATSTQRDGHASSFFYKEKAPLTSFAVDAGITAVHLKRLFIFTLRNGHRPGKRRILFTGVGVSPIWHLLSVYVPPRPVIYKI
jgi:hypothetical protein